MQNTLPRRNPDVRCPPLCFPPKFSIDHAMLQIIYTPRIKKYRNVERLGRLVFYFCGRGLHLSCAICPLRAVVLVNSAPQRGQYDFVAVPDFSRWCLSRLLNVENCRPLQPWSKHCGFLGFSTIRIESSGFGEIDGASDGCLLVRYDPLVETLDGRRAEGLMGSWSGIHDDFVRDTYLGYNE